MNSTRSLSGVVIDPGHGGTDSGATGNDILEKNYNLEISKYMYDRFKELGIPVTITREDDTTLSPTERADKILESYGNNPNVIVISNHLNSGGGTGAEVIYALRNTSALSKKILDNIESTGSPVRKYYQRRLPSDTSKDYYFIHRNTGETEPVIVEYGFIDDTAANADFFKNNYKQLAEAVVKAVADYKGIKYSVPEELLEGYYVVQKGDSLYSIARKLNTTVDELKSLNNLTSNLLSIGQLLKIPQVEEQKASTYTVQKGDSLYSISKKFNTTVDELKKTNNLSTNLLSIGQVLKLPVEEEISNYIEYKVQKGDSLYSISKKYDVSVDSIKELNNLSSNLLSIGQVLKIPTTTITETTYVVQKGDSLYSIAKKFNTTVDRLKELNNLSNNLLSIGQILILD